MLMSFHIPIATWALGVFPGSGWELVLTIGTGSNPRQLSHLPDHPDTPGTFPRRILPGTGYIRDSSLTSYGYTDQTTPPPK